MSMRSMHPRRTTLIRAWLMAMLCLSLALGAILPMHTAAAQSVERIVFPPGATSRNVAGYVDPGNTRTYVLRASAGQQMTVGASNANGPYTVSITDPRGVQIGVANSGQSWTGSLTINGDYYLVVAPVNVMSGQIFYNFVVSIPGALPPTPTPTAPPPPNTQRITFPPGGTSATLSGTVSQAQPQQYVLRALAGQQMTVRTSSSGPFTLSITGADGSYLGNAGSNQTLTVGLPSTQDYYILLQVPAVGGVANYYMTVTVVGGGPQPTPTPAPSQPQRINFAPGAVSATVYGYVSSSQPAAYVLKALAGQDMTVQFYGGGPYRATLTGADGSYLGTADANGTINARLPRTQDYYINVVAPMDVAASNFTMVVTVVGSGPVQPTPPPTVQRITFAPGAVSATVSGATPQDYVLKALRGQTMYVEVFTNGQPVNVTIAAASGQALGVASTAAAWSGTLPGTQDYYFRVRAAGGYSNVNFSLRVTIY